MEGKTKTADPQGIEDRLQANRAADSLNRQYEELEKVVASDDGQ